MYECHGFQANLEEAEDIRRRGCMDAVDTALVDKSFDKARDDKEISEAFVSARRINWNGVSGELPGEPVF